MEEQEARVLLTECGNELLDRKLVVRTWGNISCRIDENTNGALDILIPLPVLLYSVSVFPPNNAI